MEEKIKEGFKAKFKQTMFSPLILGGSMAKKISYTALTAAMCVVCNMFLETKILEVQFSLTITVSILIGLILGPALGFVSCFVGDFIGFLLNSGGTVYMFWVGLSTAFFAFIAGVIFYGIKLNFKGGIYLKIALICLLTFIICTVGVNTTGFYLYNSALGFRESFNKYASTHFGGNSGFFIYLFYRLFFLGQIYNSLVNYVFVFVSVLALQNTKILSEKQDV